MMEPPANPERFIDVFNGISYGGKIYVNLNANFGFVNIAGHELYQQLEKDRPDLHCWFVEQARTAGFPTTCRQRKIKPGFSCLLAATLRAIPDDRGLHLVNHLVTEPLRLQHLHLCSVLQHLQQNFCFVRSRD